MYVLVNDDGLLEVYAEETDACYVCSNMTKCPFLEAIQAEVVVPRYENINVDDCNLFKEFTIDDLIADLS